MQGQGDVFFQVKVSKVKGMEVINDSLNVITENFHPNQFQCYGEPDLEFHNFLIIIICLVCTVIHSLVSFSQLCTTTDKNNCYCQTVYEERNMQLKEKVCVQNY